MRICDHHNVPRDWNRYYADPAHVVSAADPLLAQAAEMLPPGRALDLACGPGRHSLYLARLGWRVTAVDSSPVAIRLLRAQKAGLPIDEHLADLARGEFAIPPNAYQLICDFLYLQRDLFPQIREGVHPGGVFAGAIHLFDETCPAPPPQSRFPAAAGRIARPFRWLEGALLFGSRRSRTDAPCRPHPRAARLI